MVLLSLEKALSVFRELCDGPVTEYSVDAAWVSRAYSEKDLSEWSTFPPVSCIFAVNDPLGYSDEVLSSPEAALNCIAIGNALGTWNCHGSGKYACGKDWIVAEMELIQEQAGEDMQSPGDYVSLSYGLWRSGSEWIGVLWDGNVEDILEMMDQAEEPEWFDCQIWYGE